MKREFFFVIFVILIHAEVIAQTKPELELECQKLNMKAVQNYHNGYYKEGISYAQKACDFAIKHFGKEHNLTLTSMGNLALLYKYQGQYNSTLAIWRIIQFP